MDLGWYRFAINYKQTHKELGVEETPFMTGRLEKEQKRKDTSSCEITRTPP